MSLRADQTLSLARRLEPGGARLPAPFPAARAPPSAVTARPPGVGLQPSLPQRALAPRPRVEGNHIMVMPANSLDWRIGGPPPVRRPPSPPVAWDVAPGARDRGSRAARVSCRSGPPRSPFAMLAESRRLLQRDKENVCVCVRGGPPPPMEFCERKNVSLRHGAQRLIRSWRFGASQGILGGPALRNLTTYGRSGGSARGARSPRGGRPRFGRNGSLRARN